MISIIVPTLNRPDSLKRCLDSIKNNTENYELIVIDGIKEKTKCYSEAMNIGLRKARGEYLTIPGIANDIEVTEGWADEMIAFMKRDKNIGMGVFKVSDRFGGLESYGGFINPERMNSDPNANPDYCGYGLVTRKCFERVGLMDENFIPIYCEDCDYGLRVWKAGFKVKVCSSAEIIHHHEAESRQMLSADNRAYLLKKHKIEE